MMSFMLGAYWDARPDSLEKCTEDAGRFFAHLAEADPLLGRWFEPGRSRKDALKREVNTSDTQRLRNLLLKGRNRADVGRRVFEDLGFSIDLWNGAGEEEEKASVSTRCGCYSERVSNNVLIEFPCKPESARWIENASILLAAVAEIWRPRWAGIMSKKAIRERQYDADYPFVDWMVYVPRSVPAMPPPSRVEVLKDLGSIVVVQPDPPTGDSPEELSLIRRVESLLAARG
jgi:hypothetical protein